MKRLYNITYSLLAATLLLSTQSCIKEDMSDCPSDIRVYFNYVEGSYASAKEGINPSDVSQINLYVFNADGKFLSEHVDPAPKMSKDYFITVPGLETGSYQFIAWGGLDSELYNLSEPLVPGQTLLSDVQLHLQSIQNDTIKAALAPLFHAAHRKGVIDVKKGISVKDTLNLTQDTYKINVTVDGIKANGDNYLLSVEDNNGRYRFDNSIASQTKFNYISPCTEINNGAKLTSSVTVLRLLENRSPILRVFNETKGTIAFEKNLVELLMLINTVGGKIDFSYMHEFDIELIARNGVELSFDVIINGWRVIENGSGLGS